MTSRNRNLSIIALVLVLLAGAIAVILTKPTVLGLDLRGGVELVYEGRPTAAGPEGHPAGDRRRDRDDPQAHRLARRLRARDPARRRRPDLDRPAERQERRARRRAGRQHRPAAVLRLGAEHPRQPRRESVLGVEGAVPGGRGGGEGEAQGREDRHSPGWRLGRDQAALRRRREEDPRVLRPAERHHDQRAVLPLRPRRPADRRTGRLVRRAALRLRDGQGPEAQQLAGPEGLEVRGGPAQGPDR